MPEVSLENKNKQEVATPKLYSIRMFNDDFTPFDFVIAILIQIFNKSEIEAMDIATGIHNEGSRKIGIYTLDIAETKAKITRANAQQNGYPLKVAVEEA